MPEKEIVVNFERKKSGREYFGFSAGDRGFNLVEGERFVFNSKNWDVPFAAVVQLDPKLKEASSVVFTSRAGNIPFAWSIAQTGMRVFKLQLAPNGFLSPDG